MKLIFSVTTIRVFLLIIIIHADGVENINGFRLFTYHSTLAKRTEENPEPIESI